MQTAAQQTARPTMPLEAATIPADTKQFLISKIAATPVEADPFPYFYIEDLFPDTIYRELQANLPPSSDLPSVLDNGRVQAATPERLRHLSCRRTVRLNNNEAEHLDPAIRPYWISLAKTLGISPNAWPDPPVTKLPR